MTHSAGPHSPCAGGRPDLNVIQGGSVTGSIGCPCDPPALPKIIKGVSAMSDKRHYKRPLNCYKSKQAKVTGLAVAQAQQPGVEGKSG